jgi:hypothetical protein
MMRDMSKRYIKIPKPEEEIVVSAFCWGIDEEPEWFSHLRATENVGLIDDDGSVVITLQYGPCPVYRNIKARVCDYIVHPIQPPGGLFVLSSSEFLDAYREVARWR